MSTIFNIISMHRSQELAEQLQREREELAKKKHAQVMDICQELADTMGDEAYQAWLYHTPTKGFSQAAEQKLLDLKVPAAWHEAPEYKQALEFAASFDFAAIPEVIFVR